MLQKVKVVRMYMYGGPFKHVQHLYLYGSVSRLQCISCFTVKFIVAYVEVGGSIIFKSTFAT